MGVNVVLDASVGVLASMVQYRSVSGRGVAVVVSIWAWAWWRTDVCWGLGAGRVLKGLGGG